MMNPLHKIEADLERATTYASLRLTQQVLRDLIQHLLNPAWDINSIPRETPSPPPLKRKKS